MRHEGPASRGAHGAVRAVHKKWADGTRAGITIRRLVTWWSAVGWVVRKGPSEEVTLGNSQSSSLKSRGCSVYGAGTEQ